MNRALICGFGDLGQNLAKQLIAQDMQVYAVKRSLLNFPGVKMIHSDLFSLESLPEIDIVFYMIPPESNAEKHLKKAYIHGLKHLLSLVSKQAQAPKIVLFSSTDIYNYCSTPSVDENAPIVEASTLTRTRFMSENILRNSAYPHLILRVAPIKEHRMQIYIKQLKAGKLNLSKRQNSIQMIEMKSLVETVYKLMPRSGTYNIAAQPIRLNTLFAWLSTKYGIPLKPSEPYAFSNKPRIQYTAAIT